VTGANRGIGLAFVECLIAHGVKKIYVGVRDLSSANSLVSLYPGLVHPIALDITNQLQIDAAVNEANDITLLINNAGANSNTALVAVDGLNNARDEMETNYFGTLSMCRAFAPILKSNGGGTIVNILSILSLVNLPASGSYSVSKAAAYSMNQGVRAELASQQTKVIGVMPGAVDTDMAKEFEGPKEKPLDIAEAAIKAVEDGVEDVFPGDMAQAVSQGHAQDAKAGGTRVFCLHTGVMVSVMY
jgi:NAD(P)-dependent dehydrogenase (short-subunit alcohol dehydrogenase family)